MRDEPGGKGNGKEDAQKVPLGQALLDDVFFLVALGLAIPFLLYTLWGVLEVFNVSRG